MIHFYFTLNINSAWKPEPVTARGLIEPNSSPRFLFFEKRKNNEKRV